MSTTLRQYLRQKDCRAQESLNYASGVHTASIESLLDRIVLTPVSDINVTAIPSQLTSNDSQIHSEFINSIVLYMLQNSMQYAINYGYHVGEDTDVSSNVTCPGKNMAVIFLKSPEAEIMSKVIGKNLFLDLIFNYFGFIVQNDKQLQIFGPIKIKKYIKSIKNYDRYIKINKLMYVQMCTLPHLNPISPVLLDNMKVMFPSEFKLKKRKNIPKRLRRLARLCEILMLNHEKRQQNYTYIMDNCCPRKNAYLDNIDAATDKKSIVKFVIIIFEKIFPPELYGGLFNKPSMFRLISLFVYSKKFDTYDSCQIIKNFKLSSLEWFKPIGLKMNKQEYIRLQSLFKEFLCWFMNTFLVKLLSSYFHVTELSQSRELYYYRHDVWRKILRGYKDKYFNKYLSVVPEANNNLMLFRLNEHYVGKLRFIPKKNDFRAIVVPFKGATWEKFNYGGFLRSVIKPIMRILSKKRKVNDSIRSTVDISEILYHYRKTLLESYGQIPHLFALKFDVKSCYDSIPTQKVLEIIKGLVGSDERFITRDIFRIPESDDQPYCFRQRQKYEDSDLRFMNLRDLNLAPQIRSTMIMDATKNISFSSKELFEVIHDQIFKTAILSSENTYIRKAGVFQGFYLSSMFCNILYDELVEKIIDWTGAHFSTKVIRVADDFLFLTADFNSAKVLQKIISRPIEEFNVNVNRLKTWSNFSHKNPKVSTTPIEDTLEFCKFEINLSDLSIRKTFESYEKDSISVPDFNKLYKKILLVYERRLGGSLFKVKLSTVEKVIENLVELLGSVYVKYVASCKVVDCRDKESPVGFYEGFYIPILKITVQRFSGVHQLSDSDLNDIVSSTLVSCLRSNVFRFKENIEMVLEGTSSFNTHSHGT